MRRALLGPRLERFGEELSLGSVEQLAYSLEGIVGDSEEVTGVEPDSLRGTNGDVQYTPPALHLKCRFGDGHDSYERCLVFKRSELWVETGGRFRCGDKPDITHSEDDTTHRLNQSVLAGVIYLAKNPKRIELLLAERLNLVGLFVLDECPHWVAKQGGNVPLLAVPGILAVSDGKSEFVTIRRRVLRRCTYRELVDEMIQSGPEVVDGVPEQQAPQNRIGLPSEDRINAVLLSLTIWIGMEGKGVSIRPAGDFALEGIEVLPGMIELSDNWHKGTHRGSGNCHGLGA